VPHRLQFLAPFGSLIAFGSLGRQCDADALAGEDDSVNEVLLSVAEYMPFLFRLRYRKMCDLNQVRIGISSVFPRLPFGAW
jgi:hypothetical protein